MKKWMTLLLCLGLLLSGCGAEELPEQTTDAPPATTAPAPVETTQGREVPIVELRLVVTEENLWTDEDQITQLLAEFNAYYPNILVRVEHLDAAQVPSAEADLILGDTGTLAQWAAEEKLTFLDNLWPQWEQDVYPNVGDACTEGDHCFALPLCVVADCMAIRLSAFEQAQATTLTNLVTHTWSPATFLQAADQLCDAGYESALGIYCQDTREDVYTRLLVENLEGGTFVNTINGTYRLDSREMSSALTRLADARGIAFRSDLNCEEAQEAFLSGESAMALNWNSALQLAHSGDGEINFMLYPSGGRSRIYARVYGLAIWAGENVQQQAASMTLLQFLSTRDAAVRATGQLPARKSQTEAYAGTALEETMADLSKLLSYMVPGEIPGQNWDQARKQWISLLQQIPTLEEPSEENPDPLTLAELITEHQEALTP